MAAPTQTLAPFNISALLQPDLSVEQAQIERQQQLAAYLRQQALEPLQVQSGSASWAQGVAKLVQALAGGLSQRAADKHQQAWNHKYRIANGLEQAPVIPSQMPSAAALMGSAGQLPPQAPPHGLDAITTGQTGSLSAAPQSSDMGSFRAGPPMGQMQAPPPVQPPAQVPQMSPAQGQPGLGGLSMPGGNPIADMVGMSTDMPGYMKDFRAANAPTDAVKLVTQAQLLAAQGNTQAAAYLIAQARKAGWIDPTIAKPNETVMSNMGGAPFMAPDPEHNAQYSLGPSGVSARIIPGMQDITADLAGATEGAKQAAVAQYAGAIMAAQEGNKIIPGQTVNGQEGVPVWGRDVPSLNGQPPTDGAQAPGGFVSPVPGGRVTSGFGRRTAPGPTASSNHMGMDIAAPRGSPVGAAGSGVVIATGHDALDGNFVRIRHPDGSVTGYGHLDSIGVQNGQQVTSGQPLGKLGATGNATGPNVHFSYRDPSGVPRNPQSVIGQGGKQGQNLRASPIFGQNQGTKAFNTATGTQMAAYKADLDTRVNQGFELGRRLQQQQQLMGDFRTGATADVRNRVASFARDMGAPENIVQGLGGGDPSAAQAFNKYSAQTALEQLRQSVGNNRILKTEYDAFAKANPNLTTDPNAIRKIAAFQQHTYQNDYAQQQALQQYEHSGQPIADFPAHWERQRYGSTALQATQPATEGPPQGFKMVGMRLGKRVYEDGRGHRIVEQ